MFNCLSLWCDMASSFDGADINGTGEMDMSYLSGALHSLGIQNNFYDPSGCTASGTSSITGPFERAPIRKIYVGNLNIRSNSRDLRECFSTFGKVQNAHLAKLGSGARPSYGFVTFYMPNDALTAINVGHTGNIFLHGRRLIVNEADQRYQPRELPSGRIIWNVRNVKPANSAHRRVEVEIDESKCVLHLLNDDCLRLIFSLLPKRDLIKCERVCKRWQEVCRCMWLSTKELTFSNLDLRRRFLTMGIASQIVERCGPNLVSVDLSYKPNDLQSSVLTLIAESCPNLSCLNLSNVPLSSHGLKAIGLNCKELRKVTLEFSYGVKDRDLQRFFFMCKKLETVNLAHSTSLTGKCLEGLNKESIRELSLDHCSLHSDIVNNCVASFTNLRSLSIDACTSLTSKDITVMFHSLPQLKSLSMSQYYPHISPATFKNISQLKELVNLNISQNSAITDAVLEAIARGCKKLETLDVTGCSVTGDQGVTVSDVGIAAISKLAHLKHLKMSYMALATDLALIAIAENTPKLQTLECRGCPSFHDFGCSRIVALCNELRHFDFCGCDEVSDSTVLTAINAVKLRTNNVPLKLVVGGTMVEGNVSVEPGLLSLDTQNLCAQHLRPDFVDNHYFLSESDDDDDFEDLYDVDFDVVGSPAMFFGDDLSEYYGYLAFMDGHYSNSDYEFGDGEDEDTD